MKGGGFKHLVCGDCRRVVMRAGSRVRDGRCICAECAAGVRLVPAPGPVVARPAPAQRRAVPAVAPAPTPAATAAAAPAPAPARAPAPAPAPQVTPMPAAPDAPPGVRVTRCPGYTGDRRFMVDQAPPLFSGLPVGRYLDEAA